MPRTEKNREEAFLITGLCSDDASEATSAGACLPHAMLKLSLLDWVEARGSKS